MEINPTLRRPPRHFYSKEFKAQRVKECADPGASVARVALAHGINANLVHKWRRQSERGELVVGATPEFPPVALKRATALSVPSTTAQAGSLVRIDLAGRNLTASVHWPVSHAAQCAAWLRQLLA
jgi:transposase